MLAGTTQKPQEDYVRSERPNIVVLEFEVDHEEERDHTGKATGNMKLVEYVKWAKKASGAGMNASAVRDKVARIQKHDHILWAAIEPYYKNWKEGREAPVVGTPIELLTFLTKWQIKHLHMLHIRSDEDLAALTDADLERVGMGARDMREKARAFVRVRKEEGRAAILLADSDKKIAEQAEIIKDQGSALDRLQAQVEALMRRNEKSTQPEDENAP